MQPVAIVCNSEQAIRNDGKLNFFFSFFSFFLFRKKKKLRGKAFQAEELRKMERRENGTFPIEIIQRIR